MRMEQGGGAACGDSEKPLVSRALPEWMVSKTDI